MEASEIIGCILGIPVVYVIYKVITKGFAYYLSFLAKVSNRHIILNGQDGPDPNTLDEMWQHDKERLKKLKNIASNVGQKLKNIRGTNNVSKNNDINFIIQDKASDKIMKIQKLIELKNIGALTDNEFQFLKKEILG
ncbi:MAG: hypothetical protein RIR12_2036 [Bacteroidota bacterium]